MLANWSNHWNPLFVLTVSFQSSRGPPTKKEWKRISAEPSLRSPLPPPKKKKKNQQQTNQSMDWTKLSRGLPGHHQAIKICIHRLASSSRKDMYPPFSKMSHEVKAALKEVFDESCHVSHPQWHPPISLPEPLWSDHRRGLVQTYMLLKKEKKKWKCHQRSEGNLP